MPLGAVSTYSIKAGASWRLYTANRLISDYLHNHAVTKLQIGAGAYDPPTLRESLERAGFQSIREFPSGESDDPALAGLEIRHKAALHVTNGYETVVFQAVRA